LNYVPIALTSERLFLQEGLAAV